jgi:scyllo-inosamine 4-kinase
MDRLGPELREDQALLAHVAAIAASVLRRHGDDPDAAVPTGGWVNPGWMSDRLVARVGLVPGRMDLRREAHVAAVLPTTVGYPEVVDVGVLDGHEYLLTRRISGTNLSSAWPTLNGNKRADALRQVWTLAEQVHRVDLTNLEGMDLRSSPFYSESPADAIAAVRALHVAGLLTGHQTDRLVTQLREFFDAAASARAVLNHGDLSIGNAIWDGSRVVGLLDFEFAVTAPVELDLSELAKHALGPVERIDDEQSPSRFLRQAVVDIVAELPVHASLLKGYSILLESWLTRREIGRRPADEIRVQQSCKLLVALAEEDGGYLTPLLSL